MSKLAKFRKLFPIKQEIFNNLNAYDLFNKDKNEFNTLICIIQTRNNIPYKVIKLFREVDRIRYMITEMTKEKIKSELNNIQKLYDEDKEYD